METVAVVDLQKGAVIDSFYGYRPSLSPDRKRLAFIAFFPLTFPPDVWPSDRYMVYDLEKAASENREESLTPNPYNAGVEVYGDPLSPNGPGNLVVDNPGLAHSISSAAFFWLGGEDMLAFADQWKGAESPRCSESGGGNTPPPNHRQAAGVVDVRTCKQLSENSFEVTDVKLLKDPPRHLRLRFSVLGQPCLARPTADIGLGEQR